MSQSTDDPYELHGRHFLDRLRQLSHEFHSCDTSVDVLVRRLEKSWPQVLAALRWSSKESRSSAPALEIYNGLMECANGDILKLQFHRSGAEVRRWADAAASFARQLDDGPNDAAYLYRFAGIALVQGRILKIADDTRLEVRDVLGPLAKSLLNPEHKRR